MDRPSEDQCSEHAVLAKSDLEVTYADWHPQIGGYTSPCVVSFSVVSFSAISGLKQHPGCFEVQNFHDGEFPTRNVADVKHYCDARQLVEFGLTVLEMQCEHQRAANGTAVKMSGSWKERVIKRINALPSE